MHQIKYVGPAKDYSGYGEACRHDIASLLAAGIGVTAKIPRYTQDLADFGDLTDIIVSVEDKKIPYDTIILHTTPNVYQKYMEQGAYHIARVFWETDKLPKVFADNIQLCDEVWTGSEYNKQAIINAGVTKPIYIIPQAVQVSDDTAGLKSYKTIADEYYRFYSIFEWTERKNPAALLEAYWREFEHVEGVSLVIKTYVDNFSKAKNEEIDHQIRYLKKKFALSRYAPVFLYRHLMDRKQIYQFHKSFDCFVSAHRGEGWGIPQMEALLTGHPMISTNCGGIHEYLEDKTDALLIPYSLVPLKGNSRNQEWYADDQNWAEVNIGELRAAMAWAYLNKAKAREMGLNGRDKVIELFNFEAVGAIMKNQLNNERT